MLKADAEKNKRNADRILDPRRRTIRHFIGDLDMGSRYRAWRLVMSLIDRCRL